MPLILYTRTPESESMKAFVFDFLTWLIPSLYAAARLESLTAGWIAGCTFVALTVGFLAYIALMTARCGATLGGMLTGIRIVASNDGSRPSLRQAITRLRYQLLEGIFLMITGGIGFIVLWLFRRKHHVWWHDEKAGTKLVWARQKDKS